MNEVLIEFVEVVINQIVYLRSLYPSQIFKKQKAYGLMVYGSLYPPLNNYIKSVLLEALSLMNLNNLMRVELRIYKEESIYESYFIEIHSESVYKPCQETEDEFRSSIHTLNNRCKSFNKLSKDCRFKLLLHTKSYNFHDEKKNLDSLWIKDSQLQEDGSNAGDIVPVSVKSCDNLLKFYVECFRK